MQSNERILHLDICNYSRIKLCPLYDNTSNVSGQATDIFVTTERNGWKELSFTLPSVCMTADGVEPNYRLDFLKADFLIRLIDDHEIDWFIISEPKITHNAYAKTVQVTAGHIAQLLKHKNLGLEFSDDAGNNVGTARQLAETILNGTGWSVGYVYPFAEKDGSTKYRSLKAAAKTGAFKLIASMCDLFDAKPIYHGDNRTVDIVPINPFSEPAPGAVPDLGLADDVVELHYGKNVSNVTRTMNTENIVTKLYAYGSYGDKTSGYCGIDECVHTEYAYVLTEDCLDNQVYYFAFDDDAGVSVTYHFTTTAPIKSGSKLIYSLLDPSSMMYIWDDSNQNAYPVVKGTAGIKLPANVSKDEKVQNWFQFVMNFDYYREVGLLTDEMIQIIADYQRSAPGLYQKIADASLQMSNAQTELSETIGYIDFCKLDVKRENSLLGDGYITLELDKSTYSDGVIYRTDYDVAKDNRFEWRVTESLNTDGDPINAAAGILYIVHNTTPVTWDKAYLKALDNEDNPSNLTLWAERDSIDVDVNEDQFYLFSYNGINGRLGALESNDESALMSIEEAVKVVTVDHPVIFTQENPALLDVGNINGYGWLWRYYAGTLTFRAFKSELYFAYTDKGDTSWNYVYFTDSNPGGAEENAYWFDWRNSVLYKRQQNTWQPLTTSADQKIASLFATVYMFGKARDRYYQGLYEKYKYTVPVGSTLPAGNYFIENEYNSYWAFTTNETLSGGDSLTYTYDNTWITQVKSGIETTIKPKGYRFDNVSYHPSNILSGKGIEDGAIGNDGITSDSDTQCRTQSFISVVPLTNYLISGSDVTLTIHYYDDKKGWLSSEGATLNFTTPAGCTYIRLCADVAVNDFTSYSNAVIQAENSANLIVIEDLNYVRLQCDAHGEDEEIIGLVQCIDKFNSFADLTYDTYYSELKSAQDELSQKEKEMTEAIGDLYREGWWQDASYVDGDEEKLYADSLDNLNQIAKPEAAYNITYLDTYQSNVDNQDFGAANETIDVLWPDLSMMSAVHLVDPEIAVNTWAFIDKIQKCYDQPWQTKIVINTNLSTIAQHSFADVMTNIATVASEMKGKTSYYDKTLGGVATSGDITQIQAELNKNEKELVSTFTRMDRVDNLLVTHSSSIKQNADEISSEVSRATEAENYLSKQVTTVKQTADGLVTEMSSVKQTANSAIEQTAKFEATVEGYTQQFNSIETRTENAEALASQAQTDAASAAASASQAVTTITEKTAQYEQSLDKWSAEFSEVKTTANNAADNAVKTVESQVATYQATVDGFAADISSATQTANSAQNTANEASAKATSVEATVNGLSATVKNLNESSIFTQTADTIRAVVRGDADYGGADANEFNTSSVSVTKDGVAISTNGTFSVSAGDDDESSAVTIDKNGVAIGSSGVFTVQTDNFGVTPDGKISASNAVINGQISNNGYPVLTRNYDLYVGSEEPTSKHTGMIWIKPGVPSSGSSSGSEEVVVPTNQTVTFTGTTDTDTRHWFYEEGSANVSLTSSGYSAGSKSTYSYSVTIPVYLARRSDGQKHGAKFKVSLNGSVTLTETKTWSSTESASNMTDTVTLSGSSSVWLGDLSYITAVISISRESTGSYTGNIYLDRNQNVVATCS